MLRKEDDDERGYNIVDALNVATCWMAHVPNIKQSSDYLLYLFVPEEGAFGDGPQHVVAD